MNKLSSNKHKNIYESIHLRFRRSNENNYQLTLRAKPHAAIPMHNSCPVRYVQSTRYLPNVEFLPFDLHESCTHTRALSLSPSLFLSLAPCAEASDRRCWVSARSVKMASKGRWKGRARFTAMRDALIFIYGNRLYARNHPRPIYSGGDGGSGGGCTRENPYALVWSKLGYSSDITHPPST